LAGVLDGLLEKDIDVEEMTNNIFAGAQARGKPPPRLFLWGRNVV